MYAGVWAETHDFNDRGGVLERLKQVGVSGLRVLCGVCKLGNFMTNRMSSPELTTLESTEEKKESPEGYTYFSLRIKRLSLFTQMVCSCLLD